MGILQSEASNRTTIHTLKCLSVWFTNQRMVKNGYFVSNPIVQPVEKPDRNATHVPPENEGKTVVSEKDKPLVSGGTLTVESTDDNASIHHQKPDANGIAEQNLTHSFPLLSLAEQEEDNDLPSSSQCPALLQECSTIGKEKSSENVP